MNTNLSIANKTSISAGLGVAVLSLAVSLLSTEAVQAAAIGFDDTNPNDTITLTVNDFEGGFSVNGTLIQQGTQNPATLVLKETDPLNFVGRWIDLGQTPPTQRTIYLVEPNDPTLISDILHFNMNSDGAFGLIEGSFVSDFEDNLGHLPAGVNPADVFIENGQPVPFNAPFLSGYIMSDVPEPTTIALFALGGLAAMRRSRR
jgi:hypothetical protein